LAVLRLGKAASVSKNAIFGGFEGKIGKKWVKNGGNWIKMGGKWTKLRKKWTKMGEITGTNGQKTAFLNVRIGKKMSHFF
jgi:hypothetical protein